MSDIHIDVRGTATTNAEPQLAVVYAAVTADGPAPEPVKSQVSEVVAQVRSELEALHVSGAVARFAVDQIRISAHRPWNDRGEQLPLVHAASVAITADFTDFGALSWVMRDGLTVHHIEWALTNETRIAVERATRQHALRNAVTHAQDYADALDLGEVRIRSVRDPGVEPEHGRMMMAGAAMAGGSPDIDLVPAPIEVTAEVIAGFTVG